MCLAQKCKLTLNPEFLQNREIYPSRIFLCNNVFILLLKLLSQAVGLTHLSISCRRGEGRAWGGDLIVFVGPGVWHLTDLVLPGEGIFESFFARRGDIWLPTRTKKTETEHMFLCFLNLFPASTLHACAVRSREIWKSWRPTGTSEHWVDFTVLS